MMERGRLLFGRVPCVCTCVCVFFCERESMCVCTHVCRGGGKLERFGGRGLEQNSGTEPKPETHANLCLLLVVMKGSVQDTRDTN